MLYFFNNEMLKNNNSCFMHGGNHQITLIRVWWSPPSVKLELLFCNISSCKKHIPALLHVSSTLCPSDDNQVLTNHVIIQYALPAITIMASWQLWTWDPLTTAIYTCVTVSFFISMSLSIKLFNDGFPESNWCCSEERKSGHWSVAFKSLSWCRLLELKWS